MNVAVSYISAVFSTVQAFISKTTRCAATQQNITVIKHVEHSGVLEKFHISLFLYLCRSSGVVLGLKLIYLVHLFIHLFS